MLCSGTARPWAPRCVVAVHLIIAGLVGTARGADGNAGWQSFIREHRYDCPGPFETLETPRTVILAAKPYVHNGYRMDIQQRDSDDTVRIGIISAIKDTSAGTRKNLDDALAWFQDRGVEWVVANGDLAQQEFDMEEVLERLGKSGLATLLLPGNSDSNSSLGRAYRERMERYPNLVNGVWVRQVVADDVEFWTVPGYHDRRFIRQGAGCKYEAGDLRAMRRTLKADGRAPVVLVAHGPPAGSGATALDWISQKKNVGDPELNKLIERSKIPFGLFGHILEAGGWAVGDDFSTRLPQGRKANPLYLNAGSLSGDPWLLNGGSTSYGMATIVTIEDAANAPRASYEVKRFTFLPPG